MICAVLYAEPTNSADVGQTLLETREAAFLGATKGATILRAPRIMASAGVRVPMMMTLTPIANMNSKYLKVAA